MNVINTIINQARSDIYSIYNFFVNVQKGWNDFWDASLLNQINFLIENPFLMVIVFLFCFLFYTQFILTDSLFWKAIRKKDTSHGSAEEGTVKDIKKYDKRTSKTSLDKLSTFPGSKILVGTMKKLKGFVTAPYHLLVVAPTRAGKGIGMIIPSLLTYKGSLIVNDLKGENWAITQRRRKELGNRVFVLDPYRFRSADEKEQWTHKFNPLDDIVAAGDDAIAMCRDLVAIIGSIEKEGNFFSHSARAVITSVVCYVCTKYGKKPDEKGYRRDLGTVRDLLAGTQEEVTAMYLEMQQMKEYNGIIKKGANSMLKLMGYIPQTEEEQKKQKEAGETYSSVMQTVDIYLEFLDDPRIREVLSDTDFDFGMFRYEPSTLFFIVSPNDLLVCSMIIKLVYKSAIRKMQVNKHPIQAKIRNMPRMKLPCVFLMDEFAQLKECEFIKSAMSIIASFGVQFVIVVQGLSQLREYYKDGADEFINNSSKLFVGCADKETSRYISEYIGQKTIEVWVRDAQGKSSVQKTGRDLLTSSEILLREAERPIFFHRGVRPLFIDRLTYYENPAFRGMYDRYGDIG